MKTINEFLTGLEQLSQRHPAIPSGFADLDRGPHHFLRRGMLSVLAGRPGMGLSTLAAQMAINIAGTGSPVAYFAPDSSNLIAAKRIFDCDPALRTGNLPLYVDSNTLDIAQIRASALSCTELPSLVVVDSLPYACLVSRRNKAYRDIGKMYALLKSFALTANLAVLCITYLSRLADASTCCVPVLTDILNWPAMNSSVDNVCVLRRPKHYDDSLKEDYADLFFLRLASNGTPSARLKRNDQFLFQDIEHRKEC